MEAETDASAGKPVLMRITIQSVMQRSKTLDRQGQGIVQTDWNR